MVLLKRKYALMHKEKSETLRCSKCSLDDYDRLKLLPQYRVMVRRELEAWHRAYLPSMGVNQLDLGAGCGETCQFYLLHGAKRVFCFEPDPMALKCLYENFGNDPRVMILPERVDSIKIDIEGAEWGTVVETHGRNPRLKLLEDMDRNNNVALWSLSWTRMPVALTFRRIAKKLIVWLGKERRRVLGKTPD